MERKFLYQNKILRGRRKELRNNQTEAEKVLWNHLKRSGLGGFKFTRQYSVGPYVLDFYCPQARLGIELDGSQHGEEASVLYDKDREDYLKSVNVSILRFWNNEILKNLKESLDKIYHKALEGRNSPS